MAIGIDTHRDGHVAVALDRLGAQRATIAVAADAKGYLSLWSWAQALGEPAFAIEGTGSYGAGLARFLVSAGAAVYECERPRRADRRRGKSDLIDATLAAGRLLQEKPLPRLRGAGVREDLRLLLLERRGAVRAHTAALNQLHAVVVTAPEELRSQLRGLTGRKLARQAAGLREPQQETTVRRVLRRIARRVRSLDEELAEIDRELEAIVSQADARALLPPPTADDPNSGLDTIEASRPHRAPGHASPQLLRQSVQFLNQLWHSYESENRERELDQPAPRPSGRHRRLPQHECDPHRRRRRRGARAARAQARGRVREGGHRRRGD